MLANTNLLKAKRIFIPFLVTKKNSVRAPPRKDLRPYDYDMGMQNHTNKDERAIRGCQQRVNET